MEMKHLGTTGVRVPEIGIGTWEYHGGVDPLVAGIALRAFLVDTAEIYGTESIVGEAIKRFPRDEVMVATKVSGDHLGHNDVLRAAEASLHRLGVETIDLYQIHWPSSEVPIEETMGAMETLVDQGKVRFIGVSNFDRIELEAAQRAMRKYRIESNQVLYNLLEREIEAELLPYCQEQEITVLAFSPLARGSLLSRPLFGMPSGAIETLHAISREVEKTPAQVALNWCTSHAGVVAIPKADLLEHIEEDCRASGWRLPEEYIQALDAAFQPSRGIRA